MRDDITGLIFCGFVILLLFLISMILRSGRGAWLISFYNIMPKEKKAKFNEKALCRFSGNLLLFVDFIVILEVIAGLFEITPIIIFLTILLIFVAICTTFYAFTNERFRK